MKNLLIAILGLAVFGLGATLYFKQPAPEPVSAVVQHDQQAPAAMPLLEPEAPAPASADSQLEKAHELIGALLEENQTLVDEEAQPDFFTGLKQMVDSPEMKDMVRSQMLATLDFTHGGLFRKLGLDAEQQTALKALLIEMNMAGMESGLQMMSGTKDERAAAVEALVALRKAVDDEALKLLGEEKYAVYQDWQDTQQERQLVQQFNMDEEKTDQLVHLMRDARKDFGALDKLAQPEQFNPAEMTPEFTGKLIEQTEQLHSRYLEDATELLDEEQLTRFETSLEQQRKMMEMGLKMSGALFGGKPPATGQ